MSNQKPQTQPRKSSVTRREFIGKSALAIGGLTIVPRRVLGGPGYVAPSDKVNLAIIGSGGQGIFNMKNFMAIEDVQVVSVCDANEIADYSKFYFGGEAGWRPARDIANKYYAEQSGNNSYKGCSAYVDFREMLAKEKGIDACVVATTDNTHAIAAMAAIKSGKHVYCEKPLSHDIYEARMLTEAAHKHGVATQMGNQGHAMEGNRLIKEWVMDGAIGTIEEVHIWTNRPFGYWPQGVGRPATIPSVPRGLDWNLWLGPAKFRPYHPDYAPFNWRGFWDFGTGALGDMGCHLIDTAHFVLDLPHPNRVEASCTPVNDETAPVGSIIHYDFPASDTQPGIRMSWFDGGLLPPRPRELEAGRRLDKTGGLIFIGSKGKIMCSTFAESARLIPESAMKAYTRPPKTLARTPGIRREWIRACKGGEAASSNFDVSGPLTEIVLLGNVAVRMNNQVLEWDGEAMKITNNEEANKYVKREYYGGWTL